MRQKTTYVQQTRGLKSRVRTSFRRSKFVSYSGLGSPKTKVRRNENTPEYRTVIQTNRSGIHFTRMEANIPQMLFLAV